MTESIRTTDRLRALVTGANGFLGSAVVDRLTQDNWDVITVVRKGRDKCDGLAIDFSDDQSWEALDRVEKIDVIIHLASHVDFSPNAPLSLFLPTNHKAIIKLTELGDKFNSHILFVSGTLIFGDQTYVDKSSEVSPGIPYARAKCLAERILKTYRGPLTILRPGGIFGYPGPKHLGVNVAIAEAIELGNAPVCYGPGNTKRNYIFVEDLADIILFSAKKKITGEHLVGGVEAISILQMLQLVRDAYLDPSKNVIKHDGEEGSDMIVEVSKSFPQTRSFAASLARIKELLGTT